MCISLNAWPGYIVGAATIVNAAFNAFVVGTHPAFKSGVLSRTGDPSAGYKTAQEEAAAMIAANPQLEAKATAAIVGGATAIARASIAQQVSSAR